MKNRDHQKKFKNLKKMKYQMMKTSLNMMKKMVQKMMILLSMMSRPKKNISQLKRDKEKNLKNCKKNKIRKGSVPLVKVRVSQRRESMKMMRWMMMIISSFWIIRGGRKN